MRSHKKDSGDRRCRRGYDARARRMLQRYREPRPVFRLAPRRRQRHEFAVNDTEFAAIPVYRSATAAVVAPRTIRVPT